MFCAVGTGVSILDFFNPLLEVVFLLTFTLIDKLDLTNISEVAILGEGEGFDQLVLPLGHGNMVKSMIRQHFRDKKLASANTEKLDVVRGKGMLMCDLHFIIPKLIYQCRKRPDNAFTWRTWRR